jgi:hypothetical protein
LKLRTALEKCVVALERVWEVEEMGYTPDDPESESGVSVCDKCEGVQQHNHKSHAENCPQPIIEDALATAAMWLCCEVATHSLECTCGSCVAALEALPLLPELAPKYKEQFERRKAVTEFVKARDATP